MCGIFGSTTSESQIEADSALLDLIHRGPDQQMVLTTQFCAIAYTRLAIVNENLPIHASVGCNENLTCFLNGEVYNFKKLRDSLVDLGHSIPEKYTDSDILCHLYEEYGDFFPNYLDGMFSIVIHDKKTGEIKGGTSKKYSKRSVSFREERTPKKARTEKLCDHCKNTCGSSYNS